MHLTLALYLLLPGIELSSGDVFLDADYEGDDQRGDQRDADKNESQGLFDKQADPQAH